MTDTSVYFIKPNSSIKEAIEVIDRGAAQVALVVGAENQLCGILTDGDIRRAILKGVSLEDSASKIMTNSPYYVTHGTLRHEALDLMREKIVHHVPVVDENMKITDLFVLDDLIQKPTFPNSVVLMAGGKGERLKPLTNACPKPMLAVNGKPILEIILENCKNAGFSSFYISVNYLKDQIIDYFGDGCKWGFSIKYLEEDVPLGTCGSLNLLPSDITEDIVVMNGDIITDLDIDRLMRFHQKSNSLMTVCTRSHKVRIPFAVLNTTSNYLTSFWEKPIYDYKVNAGVYVLNPKCLHEIPQTFFNMTDLMDKLLSRNKKLGVFPIHESWMDIGNKNDFYSYIKAN
jgi:dTDP-glucose pyrophosphorylase